MTLREKRAAFKAELRNAKRRKSFRWTDVGVPFYDRPCGCHNSASLLTGVRLYRRSREWAIWTDSDLVECLQCGATWRQVELRPSAKERGQ